MHTVKPRYFNLSPEIEKAYGYFHGVKIGNSIKVSGAVSMDNEGAPTAAGDILLQMKDWYADLVKILNQSGSTFDDSVAEKVFTTEMPTFLEHAGYRSSTYRMHFPTGNWLEVKSLAMPEFLIGIELQVRVMHG